MAELAEQAWVLGGAFAHDLSRVQFGSWTPDDGGPAQHAGDPLYYRFLAGLTRFVEAERVVEFGTHHGGSALAMALGLGPTGAVVTFDVERAKRPALRNRAQVHAHVFDGVGLEPLEVCRQRFDGQPVDLAFIDCEHSGWETMRCFVQCEWMGARFIALDDIGLNDEMRSFWDMVRRRFGPDHCIDVATVVPDIRPSDAGDAGFGLVRLPRGRSAGWLRDHAYLAKRRLRR